MAIGMAGFSTESLPRVRIILRNLIHLFEGGKRSSRREELVEISVNHGKIMEVKLLNFLKLIIYL